MEEKLVKLNLAPAVPTLQRTEKSKTDIRYLLIAPYATAHIYWDDKEKEMIYDLEEPILSEEDKQNFEKIETAMLDMVNINMIVERDEKSLREYVDRTLKLIISELGLEVSEGSYEKLFYYIYRNFIGLNEIEALMHDYYIEDIECNGVDQPIYIIHRVFRNLRTNIKFTDIDKLASFVEKLAQKTGRYISYASPLLDGSLPDGSLDYNEPVIYKENGIIKVSKIGSVMDKFYDTKIEEPVIVNNIEVPAFDKEFKIKWKKARYVYRHKIDEEIYELKTEFGKSIRLTGCHSIFSLTKNGIEAKRTDELKERDYVAIPLSLPAGSAIDKINLAEELSKLPVSEKFVLSNIPAYIYDDKKQEIYNFLKNNYKKYNQAYYEHKKKRILPLKLYYLLEDLNKCKISTTSSVKINPILKIDYDLMRFLGLYTAEGWLNESGNHHRIFFCFHEKEKDLIEDVRRMAKKFGADIYVEKPRNNAVKVVINSLVLHEVLKNILKVSKYAKKKRVPEIVFNIENELKKVFLRAWADGDYGSTASEELMNDITYLSLFNRDSAAFYNRERELVIDGRKIKSKEYYTNFFAREPGRHEEKIPVEVFNPLRDTHMRLRNNRINRERLKRILQDLRYQRFRNLKLVSDKFLREWEKRGFIYDGELSDKGKDTLKELDIVEKLIDSELGFAKILSIKKIKPSGDYVYDFSVDGDENFIGGVGGLCCHNSRVNATYTTDITSKGPTFTIRKFTKIPWTPIQLLGFNSLSPEMLAYFWILLQYKSNILITGGTASGKTTLLNAIAFFIPPESRVVSIEDTREINLPRQNWLPSVARTGLAGGVGEVNMFRLLKNSFRQNPDYVIVGEVRGKEAYVLFQGMASGHASISTMHADSIDSVIRRLETPPISLNPALVNSLDAIAIMTHAIVKGIESRKLREIVEVVDVDRQGVAMTNTPFVWNPGDNKFYFKKDSKVFEKIQKKHGIPKYELEKEFELRIKLIYELFRRKIIGFEDVEDVVNEYYKNSKAVLAKFGLLQK